MTTKGIFLLYGNCQVNALAEIIKKNMLITQAYDIRYITSTKITHGQPTSIKEDEIDRVELVFEQRGKCSSLPMRSKLKNSTLIVTFPAINLLSLWPLTTFNDPAPFPDPLSSPYIRFPYRDRIIFELINKDLYPDKILKRYLNTSINDYVNPLRMLEIETVEIESLDNQCDISLADLILEDIKNKQLFWSYNHPKIELFTALADRLITRVEKLMGISKGQLTKDICNTLSTTQVLSEIHVPIHPNVVDSFALKWHKPSLKYHCYDLFDLSYSDYWQAYILDAYTRRLNNIS